MEKVKFIVCAILRVLLLAVPGVVAAILAWPVAPAVVAILAAVGCEMLFLILFSFAVVAVQASRAVKRADAEEPEPAPEAVDN